MKRFWVILVSAVLIGGLGYLGWQYGQNRDKTNTNQQQTNNDPSEGGKYLVIKEWGIRFPLPERFRGTVTYKTQGQQPHEGSAVFATSLLSGTDCDLRPDPEDSNFWRSNDVYLSRGKQKRENKDYGPGTVIYYDLGKTGDFWYSYNIPLELCSDLNHMEQEGDFKQALYEGFKKIEGVDLGR